MEYIMTPQLECLLKVTNTEDTRLILLSGPTGCGKNAMLEAWSESTGRSIERIMTSSSVELVKGGLVKDRMVVAIRADLLDEDIIENIKSFRKKKGVVVFVVDTSNDGFVVLPVRVKDIFHHVIELSYLSEAQEADLIVVKTDLSPDYARRLVHIATTVRRRLNSNDPRFQFQLSTRRLLIVAKNLKLYGVESFYTTIVALFSPRPLDGGRSFQDSERGHLIEMLKGKFGSLKPEPEPEPTTPTKKK
jgi:hypothetical protein